MSATPTKYAAIRISAPASPPPSAAITIQNVCSVPIAELASSAPRMKPYTPSTTRNTR
jgi:hypothetical protein